MLLLWARHVAGLVERAVSLVTALVAVADPLPVLGLDRFLPVASDRCLVQPTDGLTLVVPVVLGGNLPSPGVRVCVGCAP